MSTLEIHQFPCLSDNYGVLIRDTATNAVASIDAPDADAVKAALAEKGWTLTHILTTHHHGDHTDGNLPLKQEFNCTIIGPKPEADKIRGLDTAVGEGDTFQFGETSVKVFETPGHTLGHIAYWMPDAKVAFVGDTLFAMGCGRVFEGSLEQMWSGIAKLIKLPPETQLYCGHEYTLANASFALTIEPGNAALQARVNDVKALRDANKPTLPTTLEVELATNPFVRVGSPEVRAAVGKSADAPDWEVFGEVRTRKDNA